MQLEDYFGRYCCRSLKDRYGITTVEAAQQLTDKQLLQCRGWGPTTVKKLREIRTVGEQPRSSVNMIHRNTTIVIKGLSVIQRNALKHLFESGKINEILNASLDPMWKRDELVTVPEIHQETDKHVTIVKY